MFSSFNHVKIRSFSLDDSPSVVWAALFGHTTLISHLSVDGRVGCFHSGAIVNCVRNVHVGVLTWICFRFSWVDTSGWNCWATL